MKCGRLRNTNLLFFLNVPSVMKALILQLFLPYFITADVCRLIIFSK